MKIPFESNPHGFGVKLEKKKKPTILIRSEKQLRKEERQRKWREKNSK
ncbi:hypothetical protein ACQCVB_11060 [Fictibacillus phosphorivorans]